MEKDLVDVILEVFNKVFHIQFDNEKTHSDVSH